ncbi:sugar phosphate isomerase/epimerase [Roseospira marina]|uniref:Sugar phosphate isomerase/epimerase n=1 Tax=Roseospira marina TaxID=140057 RepID=A0A5M6IB05_9PROT|nr:sugar phosphate isomerase/epimerase [Roseospira marina]KAA5604909.1 sugar phosphate isomerase/epimerase [Roseospira marina]MBB4315249.1 sugar phosphate isomerase/epimerase [Roseospira marina]MBB5088249.1 sugar phosphate isomerase/epimerase [Roseospira marina]
MTTVSSLGVMLTRYDAAALPGAFDMLEAAGAAHVEINPALLHAIVNGRPHTPVVNQIVAALQGRPLGVVLHAPLSLNLMDDTNAAIQRSVGEASLEIAAALGARRMVVHPGWIETSRLRLERDALMARERDGLRALGDVAASAGVTLCLENMPTNEDYADGSLINHGLDCRSVAAQVAAVDHPNVAATIDVSHAYIASRCQGFTLTDQLCALAPVTRHMHLHDSFGKVPTLPRPRAGETLAYGMGDLHLPLGWGDLPWETALTGLPLPDEVSLTLEITPRYATAETLADSVTRARALAARLTGTARRAAAE